MKRMNLGNFVTVLGLASALFAPGLNGEEGRKPGTANFNVTAYVRSISTLRVTNDLIFDIDPATVSETDYVYSNSAKLVATSNSPTGHNVVIVAADDKHHDGRNFVLLASDSSVDAKLAFLLESDQKPDGTTLSGGEYYDFGHDELMVKVPGDAKNFSVIREFWGKMLPGQIAKTPDGTYTAVLVAVHSTNG